MKIHMDYLENKIENQTSREKDFHEAIDTLKNQLEISQDKVSMIKEARSQEAKESAKKIDDYKLRYQSHLKRINELELLN